MKEAEREVGRTIKSSALSGGLDVSFKGEDLLNKKKEIKYKSKCKGGGTGKLPKNKNSSALGTAESTSLGILGGKKL